MLTGWIEILILLSLVLLGAMPIGRWIAALIEGDPSSRPQFLRRIEYSICRTCGVDPSQEQTPLDYTLSLLIFNFVGMLLLYAIERIQDLLPLNPQGFGPVTPDLAFNTAASFLVTADWQNYSGETTMSHLTQIAGLTVQNFLGPGTGLAVAFAMTRAFARSQTETVGNFWIDISRAVLFLLVPLSVVTAIVMAAMGIPQTLLGSIEATTLEGAKQIISLGPVASQEAIKLIGSNGGGFFNANSAHPFENPTYWSNLFEIWAQIVVPIATVIGFGHVIGEVRQSRALLWVMGLVVVIGVALLYAFEIAGNPLLTPLGVDISSGNLEGKEIRFGQPMTALFTVATTGSGTGALDAMHDSLTPFGGMVALFNLFLGSITPGGVGSGLYGMLVVALLAVFIAGLMIGRTPEYLGKKIEAREVKLLVFASLLYPLFTLGLAGAAVRLPDALASRGNMGPHGLTEIIYAYASTTANNGSIFAGLNGNTLWYNTTLGIAMLVGRFGYIVPILALTKSLAAKKKVQRSVGTFPTDGPLFIGLVLGVLIIVYLLQYFAALALGPIAEHLLMRAGKTF